MTGAGRWKLEQRGRLNKQQVQVNIILKWRSHDGAEKKKVAKKLNEIIFTISDRYEENKTRKLF